MQAFIPRKRRTMRLAEKCTLWNRQTIRTYTFFTNFSFFKFFCNFKSHILSVLTAFKLKYCPFLFTTLLNTMKPANKADFARIIRAAGYSIKGLKAAYIHEAAFRQEIWCSIILIPLAFWLGNGVIEKLLLVGSVFLVLIAELLNSAVESVVDRIGSDYHELSGRAKDIGSAAVFMAMVLLVITWLLILLF